MKRASLNKKSWSQHLSKFNDNFQISPDSFNKSFEKKVWIKRFIFRSVGLKRKLSAIQFWRVGLTTGEL